MRWFDQVTHRLVLTAGLTALASMAAANGPASTACRIASIDSLTRQGSPIDKDSGALLLKLVEGQHEIDDKLAFVCEGDRLTRLRLSIVPGQTRSVILVTRHEISVAVPKPALASLPANGQNGAWKVSLRPVETEHGLSAANLVEVIVTADESNRHGQQQSYLLSGEGISPTDQQDLSLELILESLPEERMFHDNFKVDPSVGQFSQNSEYFPRPSSFQTRVSADSATL